MRIRSSATLALAAIIATSGSANAALAALDWQAGAPAFDTITSTGATIEIVDAGFDGNDAQSVPTPGSLALAAMAGFIGLRRRHR